MVSKITRRNSGYNLIRYCKEGKGPTKNNPHRNCYVTGLHMLPDDIIPYEDQMEKFWNVARANHSIQINHLMISAAKYEFNPKDEADVVRFADYVTHVAENVESQLGFETQWAIFIQRDGRGGCLHAHCLMNDCTFDGSKGAPHASYNHDIVRKIVDKTLLEYQPEGYNNGYIPEPPKKVKPEFMKYLGMSDYEYMAVDDSGDLKYSWKRDLRNKVLSSAMYCASWEDFEPELERNGVGFRIGNNKDGSKSVTWELKDTSRFDSSGAKRPMYGLKARGEKLGSTLENINYLLTRRFGLPSNEEPILNGALIGLQDDDALSLFYQRMGISPSPEVGTEDLQDVAIEPEIEPPKRGRPKKSEVKKRAAAKKEKTGPIKRPVMFEPIEAEEEPDRSGFDKLEEEAKKLRKNLALFAPLKSNVGANVGNNAMNNKDAKKKALESAHNLMRKIYNDTILPEYPDAISYDEFMAWRYRETATRNYNIKWGLIAKDELEPVFSYNPQTNRMSCYPEVLIQQARDYHDALKSPDLAEIGPAFLRAVDPKEMEKRALDFAHSKLKQAYEFTILRAYPNAEPYADFMAWRRTENAKRRKNIKEGTSDKAPMPAVFGKFDPDTGRVPYYVDILLEQAKERFDAPEIIYEDSGRELLSPTEMDSREKAAVMAAHNVMEKAYNENILPEYPNALSYKEFILWRRSENIKRRRHIDKGIVDEAPFQSVFGKYYPAKGTVDFYTDILLEQAREYCERAYKEAQEGSELKRELAIAADDIASQRSDRSWGE